MYFDDDEPIVIPRHSGPRPEPDVHGKVQLVDHYYTEMPLETSAQKVMLELTGDQSTSDRGGADLVAVLDVSGSMQGERMDKMKTAMRFVIKKLSPIDRLSIVVFSDVAKRICRLRQVTEASKPDLLRYTNGLKANGATNISDGLRIGLKVLADRRHTDNSYFGVMLMSDGHQNRGGDAAHVGDVHSDVRVFTFGFGKDHDGTVLNNIAKKFHGGTFSFVGDINDLSKAFSQCLGGLLHVAVHDLKLTVRCVEHDSRIKKVKAGSYRQTRKDDRQTGSVSVTVNFGDLYMREVRKVIVDLLLPPVMMKKRVGILEVTYSYSVDRIPSKSTPWWLVVTRTPKTTKGRKMHLQIIEKEEARLKTVTMIKDARILADGKNLGHARNKLVEAQNKLEDVVKRPSPLLDMLTMELQQLYRLMESQDVYEKEGRSYALSSETSHGLQRFASRGDIESMRLFATAHMDSYLVDAKMPH